MKIITVAIGAQYHREAQRLVRSLPNEAIEVFDENHALYAEQSSDPLINALYHKSNFANYISGIDANTPVLFIDADAFTFKSDPFQSLSLAPETDIAYVPYSGTWHLPDQVRQDAFDFHGHKINSGFLWFKNLSVAQQVCNQWSFEYLEREKLYDTTKGTSKYEYDEWALMIALSKLNLNQETLPKKWNDWELNEKDEILNSDSIFFQSHNYLDIV